ncbi:MAG TPA: hypothetical protein DDY49_10530 [Paenibacillaceae bacterium]|nr:hypothetical protein [Paenibacillaceae bacterium]
MTQSGIYKKRGVPTWQLVFLFIVGLLARCSSCLNTVEYYSKERLLQAMFYGKKISQSVFSRFMVTSFQWDLFNLKRIAKFQEDPETKLENDDVIALDDTLVSHDHAKKMPFLYKLFDHCSNNYTYALNLVIIHAIKVTGLQYPLLYSIWKQDNGKDPHKSKLDLALIMLKQLKKQIPETLRLWVAMDRWYFAKDLYLEIEKLGFDWVTKAKKNTTLYRKVTIRGEKRFIAIYPEVLFKEAKPLFSIWRSKKTLCMPFKDIYISIDEGKRGRGRPKKPILKPIQAVVIANLEEDQQNGELKDTFALLISNKLDTEATKIVQVYKKRWSIEVFFRNAKQELGLNDCHSTNENHLHAHLSLLFVAESLVRFAQWKYNEKAGIEEKITHGQVVDLLFHTRCEALLSEKKDSIQVYFDTAIKQYASFINEYWPRHLTMAWFDMQVNWDYIPLSR